MMLAAKLEQNEIPSFNLMNHFLHESHGVQVSIEDFVNLELQVLIPLEFDLKYVSPIPFLERYQRILGFD